MSSAALPAAAPFLKDGCLQGTLPLSAELQSPLGGGEKTLGLGQVNSPAPDAVQSRVGGGKKKKSEVRGGCEIRSSDHRCDGVRVSAGGASPSRADLVPVQVERHGV